MNEVVTIETSGAARQRAVPAGAPAAPPKAANAASAARELRGALARLVDLAPKNEDEDEELHAAFEEARRVLRDTGARGTSKP